MSSKLPPVKTAQAYKPAPFKPCTKCAAPAKCAAMGMCRKK